jgi:iron complex outermembrane receptor protein
VLRNAGSLRSRGVEVEFQAKPVRDLTLSGGVSYTDARYLDFKGVPCFPGQTVAEGCLVLRAATPASPGVPARPAVTGFDASGRSLNVPKIAGNLTVRYETGLTSNLRGFFSGSAYWRSRVVGSPNGDPNTVLGGYQIYDASAGVSTVDKRWTLAVYGRNLGDHRVINTVQNNSASPGSYQQSYNLNSFRTVGLRLDHSF